MSKSNTGRKDRRVTIEKWVAVKVAGGGSQGGVGGSWEMWANIENRDGRLMTGQDQRQWSYDYKVIVRYERTREINTKDILVYGTIRMAINSVSIDREGMKEEYVLRCSTTSLK